MHFNSVIELSIITTMKRYNILLIIMHVHQIEDVNDITTYSIKYSSSIQSLVTINIDPFLRSSTILTDLGDQ